MTDLQQRSEGRLSRHGGIGTHPHTPRPREDAPPECVEDDGALVELKARAQQLGGHHRGVSEAGRLAPNFLKVEDDVFPVSSEEEEEER